MHRLLEEQLQDGRADVATPGTPPAVEARPAELEATAGTAEGETATAPTVEVELCGVVVPPTVISHPITIYRNLSLRQANV
jgi:hypothetical protein